MSGGLQVGLISTAGQETLTGNKQLAHLESFLKIRTRFAVRETEPALTEVLEDTMVSHAISDPTEVTVICATLALARAARVLNMNVVGFTSSGFAEAELRAAGCREVYATLAELTQVIENSNWWRPSSSTPYQGQWRERLATLQQMKPLTMKL